MTHHKPTETTRQWARTRSLAMHETIYIVADESDCHECVTAAEAFEKGYSLRDMVGKVRAAEIDDPTPHSTSAGIIEDRHYAALLRLQVTTTALQNLVAAARDHIADRDQSYPEFAPLCEALWDARIALTMALGGTCEDEYEPALRRLTQGWTDPHMARDARKKLPHDTVAAWRAAGRGVA